MAAAVSTEAAAAATAASVDRIAGHFLVALENIRAGLVELEQLRTTMNSTLTTHAIVSEAHELMSFVKRSSARPTASSSSSSLAADVKESDF